MQTSRSSSRVAVTLDRAATLVAASLVALALSAGTAFAATERFMSNQGLSAGNAYASLSAHSNVFLIVTSGDHTACPAVATGYAGYTSSPFSGGRYTAYQSSLCGPGQRAWYPNPSSSYVRGATYNPNTSTFDFMYYADYAW